MSGLALLAQRPAADWLERRDPRLRILAALGFALIAVSLQRIPSLLAALTLAFSLALAARLQPAWLARRLLALEGFMLVVLLFLPFSISGTPWFEIGGLGASREGALRSLEILLTANAVVLMLLTLIGTLEPVVLGHALARLHLPDKLVHLFLFTLRYVGVLHDEYRRLRQAMRARAFVARSNRHTWRSLGWLTGMLLVRSLHRSQRVLAAMRCRGFDGRLYLLDHPRWHHADSAGALLTLMLLGGLLALEHLP